MTLIIEERQALGRAIAPLRRYLKDIGLGKVSAKDVIAALSRFGSSSAELRLGQSLRLSQRIDKRSSPKDLETAVSSMLTELENRISAAAKP